MKDFLDEVSGRDITSSSYGTIDEKDEDGCLEDSNDGDSREDDIVLKFEPKKFILFLQWHEKVALEVPQDTPKHEFCKKHIIMDNKEKKEYERKKGDDIDIAHFVSPWLLKKKMSNWIIYVKEEINWWKRWRHGFQLVQKA